MLPTAHRGDQELVGRCLSGDASAWEELYEQHHETLLAAIESMFRQTTLDPNLAEEIAGRVWYTIVTKRAVVLKRFDPARGRLTSFLINVAKNEAGILFRSEKRRRVREKVVSKPDRQAGSSLRATWTRVEFDEFIEELTPREAAFLREFLLAPHTDGAVKMNVSDTNRWQLNSRLRKKILEYFSDV